jgi:hypothetical protein
MIESKADRTNGSRLRELIKGTGYTQMQALYLFNSSRPKLFKPYSMSAWQAFLIKGFEDSPRWRPFSDQLLKRAEKIFIPMQR